MLLHPCPDGHLRLNDKGQKVYQSRHTTRKSGVVSVNTAEF